MKDDRKLLIIEDNRDITNALGEVLSDAGYIVETAANGKEGLDHLINRELPKVILLDMYLPLMDGIEFRKRQLEIPYLARIPVIGMSADKQMNRRCQLLKIHSFLRKPFELSELIEAIDEIILKQTCRI